MTIGEMHYSFKRKLNKIDSQNYENLKIPEIDVLLNEAVLLFIKLVAEPRNKSYLGFEKIQRTIDDIRTLVVTPESNPNDSIISVINNIIQLPENYLFYINLYAICNKKTYCKEIPKCRVHIKQQDDEFDESILDKSNFEWRYINGIFVQDKIVLKVDKNFDLHYGYLSYIKKPVYIHNAAAYHNGQYELFGNMLTGTQDCELPSHTHDEIVDIAVTLATNDLNIENYKMKLEKLKMNGLWQ